MNRLGIYGFALILAGWAAPGAAADSDADIVLQNDSPHAMFVRGTDNNGTPPTTSMQVRLDPGVGTTVFATLDPDGHYNVTWTATDAVDPPTKSQSGNCRGERDTSCPVDLTDAIALSAPAPAPAPATTPAR